MMIYLFSNNGLAALGDFIDPGTLSLSTLTAHLSHYSDPALSFCRLPFRRRLQN